MSATQLAPVAQQAKGQDTSEQRLVLYDIDWQTYEKLLAAFGERPIHLTYDRGMLEIMTLSSRHERIKSWISRSIEAMCLELSIAMAALGSTTYRREDLERGLEPDECYYVQNEPLVRDVDEIDLTRDPPPDLAIEVDISHSSKTRAAIYAAMRVPELWRYNGERLLVFRLRPDGEYELSQQSLCFPFLPLTEFALLLQRPPGVDQTSQVRSFVEWVRSRILPGLKGGVDGLGQKP
jgi:Uma2 family endonuclease